MKKLIIIAVGLTVALAVIAQTTPATNAKISGNSTVAGNLTFTNGAIMVSGVGTNWDFTGATVTGIGGGGGGNVSFNSNGNFTGNIGFNTTTVFNTGLTSSGNSLFTGNLIVDGSGGGGIDLLNVITTSYAYINDQGYISNLTATNGTFLARASNGTIVAQAYNATTINADLTAYAPLASPALTGTPTAPNATVTDTAQIATLHDILNFAGSANIATVGTITTGTWNGTILTGTFGGTGVNNGASKLTYAANVTFAGANRTTFTTSVDNGNLVLPGVNSTIPGYLVTNVSNAAYTILPTDDLVVLTNITTQRTFTLPAGSSVYPGKVITIADGSGNLTSARNLLIVPNGTDRIGNGSTQAIISSNYSVLQVKWDGILHWQVLSYGGAGDTGTNWGRGSSVTAQGTAFGVATTTSGVAAGYLAISTTGVALGNGANSTTNAIAEGTGSKALATNAIALNGLVPSGETNGISIGGTINSTLYPGLTSTGGNNVQIGGGGYVGSWRAIGIGDGVINPYVSTTVIGTYGQAWVPHGLAFGRGVNLLFPGTMLFSGTDSNLAEHLYIGAHSVYFTDPATPYTTINDESAISQNVSSPNGQDITYLISAQGGSGHGFLAIGTVSGNVMTGYQILNGGTGYNGSTTLQFAGLMQTGAAVPGTSSNTGTAPTLTPGIIAGVISNITINTTGANLYNTHTSHAGQPLRLIAGQSTGNVNSADLVIMRSPAGGSDNNVLNALVDYVRFYGNGTVNVNGTLKVNGTVVGFGDVVASANNTLTGNNTFTKDVIITSGNKLYVEQVWSGDDNAHIDLANGKLLDANNHRTVIFLGVTHELVDTSDNPNFDFSSSTPTALGNLAVAGSLKTDNIVDNGSGNIIITTNGTTAVTINNLQTALFNGSLVGQNVFSNGNITTASGQGYDLGAPDNNTDTGQNAIGQTKQIHVKIDGVDYYIPASTTPWSN